MRIKSKKNLVDLLVCMLHDLDVAVSGCIRITGIPPCHKPENAIGVRCSRFGSQFCSVKIGVKGGFDVDICAARKKKKYTSQKKD